MKLFCLGVLLAIIGGCIITTMYSYLLFFSILLIITGYFVAINPKS